MVNRLNNNLYEILTLFVASTSNLIFYGYKSIDQTTQ
ncbi:hypothetical protein CLV81_2006 [Flagellimonas meridianipacifica]|uniref:Uncharacterized protein n=1 Tax=Flagellimonas meridianipacifica TaxID=1080225 RepID=A0A2T0M7Z0_9FLAO|nr:hypothetical protein CLV81_2006 [Allomuricauda pacifica]